MDLVWKKKLDHSGGGIASRRPFQGVPMPVDSLILARERFANDRNERSRSRSPLYAQAVTSSHSSSSSSKRHRPGSERSSSSKSSHSSSKTSSRSTRSRSYSTPAPTVYPHDSISEAHFPLHQPYLPPQTTRRYSQTGAPRPMIPFIPSPPYLGPGSGSGLHQSGAMSPTFPQSPPSQRVVSMYQLADLGAAPQWPQAGKIVVENGIMYVTARAGGSRAKEWSSVGIRLVVVRRMDGGNVTIPANPKLTTVVRLEVNGSVSVR